MKKQLPLLLLLAFYALLSQAAKALPVNVQKQPGSNEMVGNLVVPSGGSITATGTGQIAATTLSPSYTGQTSITTLGTITTGTWNGTILDGAHGGTGVNNSGKTVTLGGNFITSGAFSATLTFTATTNATLPAGTHSLAPLDAPVFTSNITTPKTIWTGNVFDSYGTGTPEANLTADVGSTFRRTDGGTSTTFYVKESGAGNTGWVVSGNSLTPQFTRLGVGVASTTARPIYFTPTATSSAFSAYIQHLGGTIVTTANNDSVVWSAIGDGAATISTSTFTGLTEYMLKITAASKAGSGTIDNVYGIHIDIGTSATNNYAINVVTGKTVLQDLTIDTAKPLSIKSGTNQRAGNATLAGGTVTVSNTTVTANSILMLTRKTSGGTIGTAITYTVSAGTSFTINSDNVLDTSTFSYFLVEVP